MIEESSKRPLLSICVPTFNRDTCLENLFKNLETIKNTFENEIEICVSNNHSTDNTELVINAWRDRLSLKAITQKNNIGATCNCIAVVRLATGKWIQIIGDDDEFILANFGKFMNCLIAAEPEDWVLLGCKTTQPGNGLDNVQNGIYAAKASGRIVLRLGLSRLGFIGKHVFPSILKDRLLTLDIVDVFSWPHLALLLRHLRGGRIRVLTESVVAQAAGGQKLFWDIGTWVRTCLQRLDIIDRARKELTEYRWLLTLLLLRELFSITMFKQLVGWKILKPSEFVQLALKEYASHYRTLGVSLSPITNIHFILLLVLLFTPHIVFKELLRFRGSDMVRRYGAQKELLSCFDAEERGL